MMMNLLRGIGLFCAALVIAAPIHAATESATQFTVEDMQLTLPAGWTKQQEALDNGTSILGFANGNQYVTLYVKNQTGMDFKSIFVNDSQVSKAMDSESHGKFSWKTIQTSKVSPIDSEKNAFVKGFLTELNGHTYFGYARGTSALEADKAANAFIDTAAQKVQAPPHTFSLTGSEFKGHKYYFGWGAVMDGDPELMQNEVLYDVNHTHDIFTKDLGGNYLGFKLFEHDANHETITEEWKKLKDLITKDDMYVQYSSGHGNESELAVGVTYDEIRDNALSYPAKEIIIFTMACEAGGLVDSFNQKKSEWENFAKEGRTLMVMSSSMTSEMSQIGPDSDSEEKGPIGSPGSAFGYALWKALIGHADGFSDGVKDGFISLGEIQDFVRITTLSVTDQMQTPQWTGVFNTGLIMNRVPPKAFMDAVDARTSGMSASQVREMIRRLDDAFRVR